MDGVEVVHSLGAAAHEVHDDVRGADGADVLRVVRREAEERSVVAEEECGDRGAASRAARVLIGQHAHAETEDISHAAGAAPLLQPLGRRCGGADRLFEVDELAEGRAGLDERSDLEHAELASLDVRVVDGLQCDLHAPARPRHVAVEGGRELDAGIHGLTVLAEVELAARFDLELAFFGEVTGLVLGAVPHAEVDGDEGVAARDGFFGNLQGVSSGAPTAPKNS